MLTAVRASGDLAPLLSAQLTGDRNHDATSTFGANLDKQSAHHIRPCCRLKSAAFFHFAIPVMFVCQPPVRRLHLTRSAYMAIKLCHARVFLLRINSYEDSEMSRSSAVIIDRRQNKQTLRLYAAAAVSAVSRSFTCHRDSGHYSC